MGEGWIGNNYEIDQIFRGGGTSYLCGGAEEFDTVGDSANYMGGQILGMCNVLLLTEKKSANDKICVGFVQNDVQKMHQYIRFDH